MPRALTRTYIARLPAVLAATEAPVSGSGAGALRRRVLVHGRVYSCSAVACFSGC